MDGWNTTSFLLGMAYFQGLSFTECNRLLQSKESIFGKKPNGFGGA